MPVLLNTCPTCKEQFDSVDDIYGTSCGHLYHNCCIQEWQRRGTSCPACLYYNPSTYKIYLNFDESADNREEERKLLSSNEKILQLSVENAETQNNFLELQKQFTAIEKHKRDLEARIRQIKDSEDNFMNLQGQFTECSEHVKCLEQRVKELDIEYESQTKELQLKRIENESLESGLEAGQIYLPDDLLKDKIKFLEHRLKHISEEFEKEIALSTKLSVENLKLKSYEKHLSCIEQIVKPSPNGSYKKPYPKEQTEKPSLVKLIEKPSEKQRTETPAAKENVQKPCVTKNHVGINPYATKGHANRTNDANSHSLFIRGLLFSQLVNPLENVIVDIASKMNLSISKDDLVRVNYVDVNGRQTEEPNLQLSVQFKSKHLRDHFFAKRLSLKNNQATRNITISELMNEDVYSLFKYAKDNLKSCGYNCVFTKGSSVFAKTHRNDKIVVYIKNKAQVDDMKKKHAEANNKDIDCNVDENLYQV